jgi:exosortase F-associated protein
MILLNYFKVILMLPLPSYDSFHLLIGLLFRYVLNTVLSLVYFTPYLETVQ